MFSLVYGVLEDSVFHGPAIVTLRIAEMPTGGVFAVEEWAEAGVIGGLKTENRGGYEGEGEGEEWCFHS